MNIIDGIRPIAFMSVCLHVCGHTRAIVCVCCLYVHVRVIYLCMSINTNVRKT